jgi:hypothetical protein
MPEGACQPDTGPALTVLARWDGGSAVYDIENELLDRATLALAILADEVVKLLW